MSLRGYAPVLLLCSFDFSNLSFLRVVDYMCVCAFLQISKFLKVCSTCFRFGNLFCDVLRLFVAMFSFSVYLFRSSDVFYVLLSLLVLCVLCCPCVYYYFYIVVYCTVCWGGGLVVGWWWW